MVFDKFVFRQCILHLAYFMCKELEAATSDGIAKDCEAKVEGCRS